MKNDGIRVYAPQESLGEIFRDIAKEKDLLGFIMTLAENTNTGFSICAANENNTPYIIARYKGADVERFAAEGSEMFSKCAVALYKKYIDPAPAGEEKEEKTEDEEEQEAEVEDSFEYIEDEIYQREDELSLALGDFLEVALCSEEPIIDDDVFGEILEDILMLLAKRYGISVYRPAFVEDSNGSSVVEYPYDEFLGEDVSGQT